MRIVSLLLLFLIAFAGQAAAAPAGSPYEAGDFTEFHDPFEEPADRAAGVTDPLEPVNRGAFWANDKIYTYLLRPFCETVPDDIREAISHGVERILSPLRIGQVELDFKFRDAGSELGRFVLRGVLTHLERIHPSATAAVAGGAEDFDRAFEKMGFDSGFYLILPVLGPSTLRDGLGRIASLYVDPPFHLEADQAPAADEESLEDELKTYAAIRQSALDPYLFIRDAFHQQQTARETEGVQQAAARETRGGSPFPGKVELANL